MDKRKLNNDLTKMFCVNLYQQETVSELTSAAAYYGLEDRAIHRYQNDALFHAKVDSLVFHVMLIVGNRDSERIADLRAQLAELAQCRDHWKTSYEDVRAQLKQAEEERDELRTKGAYWETLVRSWPESLEARLAAKDAELADLRNWKESAMTVLSKIDLQAIGKEIGVRLGHDVSPEILPWIINVKAQLAESNRELDEAVENLKALGQQQMDDFKKNKAELEEKDKQLALYRKAVEPAKECLVNCRVAMEYALQYLDGIGLSAANDLKEAIEEITRTQDCIRILGEADLLKERTEGE